MAGNDAGANAVRGNDAAHRNASGNTQNPTETDLQTGAEAGHPSADGDSRAHHHAFADLPRDITADRFDITVAEASPVSPARRGMRHRVHGRPHPTSGRAVAWLGFGFGAVLSVLANWLYTWLPRDSHATGEHPSVAPQLGSAVWPLVLMLSVEVLLRVRWLPGIWWKLARYIGIGTVALGSAVISYGHVYHVLLSWGYDAVGAHVGPLAIDGFMVICGFALLSESTPQPENAISQEVGKSNGHKTFPAQLMSIARGDTVTHICDVAPDTGDTEGDTDSPTPDMDATLCDANPDLDRDNRIRAMYRSVPSTREVGAAFGLHHSTVARIVAQGDSSDTEGDGATPLRLITATDEPDNVSKPKASALLTDSKEEKP
ncbi:hypothetical protein OHB26_09570 [Nocardia sp. NBC_01503]|uniref:hypothetical protein n=1 Tax=Nocardia sp. NBC_01503 TaxID=2975997 RepID=UPI002E7C1ABC|nr:hypothetical protein [Nocardia sp. NBC_01503]WTL34424.1 hypothetical protein OHB26_09570 [Nocardia sp. NBC_01503]